MATTRGRVKGGQKLRRFLGEAKAASRRMSLNRRLFVGFRDRFFATIAGTHEFGLRRGGVRVPKRPAFQQAFEREVMPAFRQALHERAQQAPPGTFPRASDLEYIRRRVEDAARLGYTRYRGGPPLGERQEARKAGTRGAGKYLVGSRGPRLAQRITAWYEG